MPVSARCRTIPRAIELVYAGLPALGFLVGVGLVLGGLFGRMLLAAGVGVIFIAAGIQQGLQLFRTATELEVEQDGSFLTWRTIFCKGSVPLAEIERIDRSTRPGVYSFRCSSGRDLPFWLGSRDAAVQAFFSALQVASPTMSTTELYRKGRLWWRGLSPPGNTA